jgi:microcystin-dependent protein
VKLQTKLTAGALVAVAVVGAYLAGTARAAGIPTTDALFYSGVLEDNGAAVNGNVVFILSLWDDLLSTDVAVNRKCDSGPLIAPVVRGRFRIRLPASCVDAVRANPDLYVDVVARDEPLGRTKLGAVPYAIEAGGAGALVPAGAVMAFDLGVCPAGWAALVEARGRAIVGVNPGANGLSARTLGEVLGEESHTLSTSEMPSHTHVDEGHGHAVNDPGHNHRAPTNNGGSGISGFQFADAGGQSSTGVVVTTTSPTGITSSAGVAANASTGSGVPHNNMQPSLALLYCKKS